MHSIIQRLWHRCRAEHSLLLHAVLPESTLTHLKTTGALRALAHKSQTRSLNADTPAERLLSLLEGLVEGLEPPIDVLLSVIASLRTRQNLYAPSDLGQRMRDAGMDVSSAHVTMM